MHVWVLRLSCEAPAEFWAVWRRAVRRRAVRRREGTLGRAVLERAVLGRGEGSGRKWFGEGQGGVQNLGQFPFGARLKMLVHPLPSPVLPSTHLLPVHTSFSLPPFGLAPLPSLGALPSPSLGALPPPHPPPPPGALHPLLLALCTPLVLCTTPGVLHLCSSHFLHCSIFFVHLFALVYLFAFVFCCMCCIVCIFCTLV